MAETMTINTKLLRRYLVGFSEHKIPHIFTDVIVIGAGAAGLAASIEASQFGEVILINKGQRQDCNTYYAQGGMAAAVGETDSCSQHIQDTLSTGRGLCDEEIVRDCISAAPDHIVKLQKLGVPFDSGDASCGLDLGREGGHNANRIIHAAGDSTGRVLLDSLMTRVASIDNIKTFENCFTLDLLTDPPGGGEGAVCVGVLTDHPRYGMQIIIGRRTILATGGAGILWRETSNPPRATADGIAMAFRAGAVMTDLEFMQFHPTTLYVAGSDRFLISEAVRGEGGLLLDKDGNRFMSDYHQMVELAPRDVVSRAIIDRMVSTGASNVFLDVRHIGQDKFAKRFPTIFEHCMNFDINPSCDLIPVSPAAHYMIGGVRVDRNGQSSIEGLMACGESACTGLHGANRLASNSLTEAIVFGSRCGAAARESMSNNARPAYTGTLNWHVDRSERTALDLNDIRNSLRSVMWRNVGLIRNGARLQETLEIISFWSRYVLDKEFVSDPGGWEIQNMLTTGLLVTSMSIARTETRGVHFRNDYPETSSEWEKHLVVKRLDDRMIIE